MISGLRVSAGMAMAGLVWAGAVPSSSSVDGPIAVIGGSALASVAFEPASGGRLVWQAAALAEEKLLQSDPLAGTGAREAVSAPWLSRIEIAADGRVRFEGRGRPGSRVTLNRHGRPAGSAQVSARGDWQLTLDEAIGAGEHRFATESEMPGNGDHVFGSDVRIAIPSDFVTSASRDQTPGGVTSSQHLDGSGERDRTEATRRRAEDLAQDASRRFSELQNERTAQAEQPKPPAARPPATTTPGSGSPAGQNAQGGPTFWLQDWLARANREFQGEIMRRLQVPGPGEAAGGVSVGTAGDDAAKSKAERERAAANAKADAAKADAAKADAAKAEAAKAEAAKAEAAKAEAAKAEAERVAAARRRAEEERKAAAAADARDAEVARQAEAQRKAEAVRKANAEAQAKAEQERLADQKRQADQARQQADQAQRAKADAEAAARQQAEAAAAARQKAELDAADRKTAEAAAAARQKEAQEAAARQKSAAEEARRIKADTEKDAAAALRTAQDRLAREQRERALLEQEIAERRRRAADAAERKANEQRLEASRKAQRGDELKATTRDAGKVAPGPLAPPAAAPPPPASAPRRDVAAKSPRLRGGDGGVDDEELRGTRITINRSPPKPAIRSTDMPSRGDGEVTTRASRQPAVAGVRMRSTPPACDNAGNTVEPPATYVVARGDSLWRIAARHYRRGHLWRYVYRANEGKIADPDLIYPCQRFLLPDIRSRR